MTKPQARVPRACTVCEAIYVGHPLQLTCSKKCKTRRRNTRPGAAERQHAWYANNRDLTIKRASERYWNDTDAKAEYDKEYRQNNKEKIKVRKQKYNEENKEKVYAYKHNYYIENRERLSEDRHQKYLANPTYYKLKAAERRAKLGGPIPVKEWNEKLIRLNFQCVYCCSKENIQIDHIKPVSKGGTNHIDNLQPLCRACNARKSDKYPYEPPQEITHQNV